MGCIGTGGLWVILAHLMDCKVHCDICWFCKIHNNWVETSGGDIHSPA